VISQNKSVSQGSIQAELLRYRCDVKQIVPPKLLEHALKACKYSTRRTQIESTRSRKK